jgi:hypothetical protein
VKLGLGKTALAIILCAATAGCRTAAKSEGGTETKGVNDAAQAAKKKAGAFASTINDSIGDALSNADFALFALKSGLLTAMHAKNMCTCVFLAGLDEAYCGTIANVFNSALIIKSRVDRAGHKVVAEGRVAVGSLRAPTREAVFDPARKELGCTLK